MSLLTDARLTSGRKAERSGSVDSTPRSLRTMAIRGAMWTLGGFACGQLLRLGSNIVLAWLLFPEAFGLMLLVNMVMQGLQMFSDIGIGPSIIQNARGHDQSFINTAWTVQIIRGVVLWLAACVLAWPLAWLFSRNDPLAWQLVYLIPVAGLMAIIGGFFSTHLFTLNRQLAMERFIAISIGSQIAGIIVMVGWAIVYPSVWALVAGGLASYICKLVLSHTIIPGPRCNLAWDATSARAIYHLGKWIVFSTAIAYLALQADRIMLGNVVPIHVLGVYGFGLMVATMPREVLVHLTGMVLFPALSQHGRTNRETLPQKIRLARSAILPAAVTLIVAVVLLAPEFFRLLYPAEFHDAGWMAQLICASVWFTMLASTSDRALLAIGNARPLAFGNVASLLATVPAALIGLWVFSLPGFIVGYACGALAHLIVIQLCMRRSGMPIALDDLRYTAILLAFVAVGLSVQLFIANLYGESIFVQLVAAALMLALVGMWAAMYAWPILKSARA